MSDMHFRWNYMNECPSSGCFVKNLTNAANPADSIRIYGNVFKNGMAIVAQGPATNWRVYNNTFIDLSTGPMTGGGFNNTTHNYNNIIYRSYATVIQGTHGYNWFSALTGNSFDMAGYPLPGTSTENITIRVPNNADLITETLNPFTNNTGSTPEAFRLSGTIRGWPGLDVCTLDACTGEKKYNIDAFGNTRGADGVWDRGAYEYKMKKPLPPSDIVVY
jgi:hypothetical protein